MATAQQFAAIERCLATVGYDQAHLLRDVPVERVSVPIVAFSGSPFDARNACIAALAGNCNNIDVVSAVRPIAAPVAIVAGTNFYEIYRQETAKPVLLDRLTPDELTNYFDRNRSELAPQAIYRAKVWGRLEHRQLDFVDIGLLPILEEEMGERLTKLMVDSVTIARESVGWKKPTPDQGEWLVKSVFWLLAAKILQDKQVPGFIRLGWNDLDSVFQRLAGHYNSENPAPVRAGEGRQRDALLAASAEIKRFAPLGLLSTEALGYLYESALIDKATRQSLGTHSTPSWMVDYIVGKLRPWIQEMPVADRRVFEPACGHGGFLIAGLRLLSELRPANYDEDRRSYLRKRLRGIEYDTFAVEIARLSLTITDVPNPNGWTLKNDNMFLGDVLAKEAAAATIVLSNPPFERFAKTHRQAGWQLNKAAETLRRVVRVLPAGAVFGFVMPHGFLNSKQDAGLRSHILAGCEVAEVTTFADKVFRCGAPEPCVIIGRKGHKPSATVLYQRVREDRIQQFKKNYEPSSVEHVPQSAFRLKNQGSFFLAELSELWNALAHLSPLGESAEIGQGLSHKGVDDPTAPKRAVRESSTPMEKLTSGFTYWTETLMTHELPPETWLSLDPKLIGRPRSGTKCGEAQVILNYHRVSRQGWCIKALIDKTGHPVTSDFSIVRSKKLSPLVLWSLLNSPVANAFAHTHSTKRDILIGTLEALRIPNVFGQDLSALERAAAAYLKAAIAFSENVKQAPDAQRNLFERVIAKPPNEERPPTEEELRALHWRVDAEVLRLYGLSAELERKLLLFFVGVERRGVPFRQREYYPPRLASVSRLSEVLAITADWDRHSARKEELVEKKVRRNATTVELAELQNLKRLTSARRELLAPLPMQGAEKMKNDLVRRGLWRED